MREHIAADEHFERTDVPVAEAIERFRAEGQDYKVELIEDLVRDRGRRDRLALPQRPLHRPLPRPARPRHQAHQGVQAHQRRRRLLARRRRPPDAHPHLRHRLPVQGGPRGAPASGSSRRARATTASSAASCRCSCSPTCRRASPFWLPRGTHIWNELTAIWRREQRRARLHRGAHADPLRRRALEAVRPLARVPRQHVLHRRRGPADGPQAHELPRPRARSTSASCAPTATCRSAYAEQGLVHRHEPSGTLHGLLRVRHITQDDAPRLLHRGADRGGGDALPRLRLLHLPAVRLRAAAASCRRGPEKRVGSDEMWDEAEAALRRSARAATGSSTSSTRATAPSTGRRSTLHMTDAIGRSLAARHRPARLLHAGALRARLHRRRQRRAPPGDDPPRADGLVRALHRHPDRALRRRVPALAGARAGDRAADRRPPRRATRPRWSRPLREHGLRAEVDERSESIGKKIREAEVLKVPYMLVVGDSEQEAGNGGGAPPPRGRPRLDGRWTSSPSALSHEIADRR